MKYDPLEYDSAVPGMSDGATLTNALGATTSTVDIAALDSAAYEEGAGGAEPELATVMVTRSGALTPVTIFYTVSGDALAGEDFVAMPGSRTR